MGFTRMKAAATIVSRNDSLRMFAMLLRTPVNAQLLEVLTAYWNSAFEYDLAFSSEPRSRKSAMSRALRISTVAMKRARVRTKKIATPALKMKTNRTNSTSSSSC